MTIVIVRGYYDRGHSGQGRANGSTPPRQSGVR